MGHCKDCGFWDSDTKNFNTCLFPDWVDQYTKIEDDTFAIYADACDDSGLTAGLKTGPMFGCVKFKPIKKKD